MHNKYENKKRSQQERPMDVSVIHNYFAHWNFDILMVEYSQLIISQFFFLYSF